MLRRNLLFAPALLFALSSGVSAQPVPQGLVGLPGYGPGPASGPSLDLNFVNGSVIDPRITYTGSGGTFFNAAGAIVAATTNVPRIDYDPLTHAVRGLLIEEARTNLLLNSATLSTQSVATTAVAYTLSHYGAGTETLSGSCSGTLAGTGAFPARVSLTFTATAGTCTLTIVGSVLNANLEAGGFATSYIPTTGASAARAADVATLPATFWAPGAGTLIVEANLSAQSAANQYLAQMDDGSTANRITLRNNSASATIGALIVSGTALQGNNVATSSLVFGSTFKVGTAWTAGRQSTAFNGIGGGGSAASLNPVSISVLRIGSGDGNLVQANGVIHRIQYWPRAFPASAMLAGTT